jgi:hypothetical protein
VGGTVDWKTATVECLDSDHSGPSIAVTILLREEPDDEDEDEEEHDGGTEDDDGDEGYSE